MCNRCIGNVVIAVNTQLIMVEFVHMSHVVIIIIIIIHEFHGDISLRQNIRAADDATIGLHV